MPDSGSTPLTRRPHFDTQSECHEDGRKSYGSGSGSSKDSKEKGDCGNGIFDVSHLH